MYTGGLFNFDLQQGHMKGPMAKAAKIFPSTYLKNTWNNF